MTIVTNCRVAQHEEIVSLLKCPIEVKLTASVEATLLWTRYKSELIINWENHLLPIQGCLVLLKHVLRAIPIYHFMALTLNVCKDRMGDLEQICRKFLWEPGEEAHPKVPQVAWAGLLLCNQWQMAVWGLSFEKHARLLKLRCGAQLMKKHQTTWIRMVEELII